MAPSRVSSFTSGTNWTIPDYVDLVEIICRGGEGQRSSSSNADYDTDDNQFGSSDDNDGGLGGYAKGEYSISESVLAVRTPPGGSGGSSGTSQTDTNGGNGGDGAVVRQNDGTGNVIIAAGGGGGGAGSAEWEGDYEDDAGHESDGGGAGDGADNPGDGGSVTDQYGMTANGGGGGAMSGTSGGNGDEASQTTGNQYASAAAGGGGGGHNGGGGGEADAKRGVGDDAYAIAAGGGGGGGDTSNVTNATTSKGTETGGARIEIKYSDRINDLSLTPSTGEITLSWSEPLDVSSINIYRSTSSGFNTGDYTQVANGLSSSTTSYTDSSLEDGEQYYYRVENVNSWDNRLSNESNTVTDLPAPANFSATFDGTDSQLSWDKADNSTDGHVEIEKSTDDGATWTTIESNLAYDTTSYTDTTVDAFAVVDYRIIRDTGHTQTVSAEQRVTAAGSRVLTTNGVRDTRNGSVNTH